MPISLCRKPDLNPYYLLGVLNARYASFYLQKKFDSLKVLKRHLEALPIPRVSEPVEASIIHAVKSILRGEEVSEHRRSIDSLLEDALDVSLREAALDGKSLEKPHFRTIFFQTVTFDRNLANWPNLKRNFLDACVLQPGRYGPKFRLLQAASAQICVTVEGGWCRHGLALVLIRRSPPFQEVVRT